MLKSIRRKLMDKLYGSSPVLGHEIRKGFKAHPLKSVALALYMLPARNLLKISRGTTRKYRLITSAEYYNELQDLLTISRAEEFDLVRVGRDYDGGYIMLDDLPGGIAYSFGISTDVSWDKDMASRGYDVFMYDHTIDGLPEENPRFHWSKLGISDGTSQDDRLKTLEELITANGHEGERNMILKMDVEGAEWGFLETAKPETLAQFSQMTFEFHDMTNPQDPERVLSSLRKINATHQLVHLHANNFSGYITADGKNFASVLEASYVLRGKHKFSSDYDVMLPLEIDSPNSRSYPEIVLGHWNRRAQISDRLAISNIEEKILRS